MTNLDSQTPQVSSMNESSKTIQSFDTGAHSQSTFTPFTHPYIPNHPLCIHGITHSSSLAWKSPFPGCPVPALTHSLGTRRTDMNVLQYSVISFLKKNLYHNLSSIRILRRLFPEYSRLSKCVHDGPIDEAIDEPKRSDFLS